MTDELDTDYSRGYRAGWEAALKMVAACSSEEIAALRADAERYRLLRTKARIEKPPSREGPAYCLLRFEWDYDCWPRPPSIANLDAAIDRAIMRKVTK